MWVSGCQMSGGRDKHYMEKHGLGKGVSKNVIVTSTSFSLDVDLMKYAVTHGRAQPNSVLARLPRGNLSVVMRYTCARERERKRESSPS